MNKDVFLKKNIVNFDQREINNDSNNSAAIGVSKVFGGVWHVGFFLKLKSFGISGWIFSLFCHMLVMGTLKWFWIKIFRKNILLMLVFLKEPFMMLCFFLYIILFFTSNVTRLTSKLWQKLELASLWTWTGSSFMWSAGKT